MTEFLLLHRLVSYFFSEFQFRKQTIWFKRSLYTLLLINSFNWLVHYDLFFGSDSIVYRSASVVQGFRELAFLLYNAHSHYLAAYCIIGLTVLCVSALLFKRIYFVFDVLIWFLVLNLHNLIYPTLTGGNFLLNQFLLFNCFLSFVDGSDQGVMGQLKMYLHNFAVLAIMLQLCVAYFLSALAKLEDLSWLQGLAIGQVMLVDHFSLFSKRGSNPGFPNLYMILNYVILFYQLFFPLFVWLKPLKKPFLLFGILMHVYISLVMGLLMFGMIMIMGYIYFWPINKDLS